MPLWMVSTAGSGMLTHWNQPPSSSRLTRSARSGKPFEVVLWNAFPWHPYQSDASTRDGPCGPSSNRKPRLEEVAQGRKAFDALLRCFTRPLEVFAVGKVAENALQRWDEARCAGYVRHPAQGGEALFRSQFRSAVVPRL